MGTKRAQNVADPATVEAAKEMRRAGATYREIAAATGLSKATLGNYFKDDPSLQSDVSLVAEDAEFLRRINDLTDDAVTIVKGMAVEYSRRLNGQKPKKGIGSKDLATFLKCIVETRKLAQVTRGRPTSITQTQKTDADPEPSRTDQEKSALEKLQARMTALGGN